MRPRSAISLFCTVTCTLTVASAGGLAGCEKLTSTVQGVSVLTRTPDLKDAGGMDPDLVTVLPLDDVESNATALLVGVGDKGTVTSTSVTPIDDATVTLSFSGKSVTACAMAEAAGSYRATSVSADTCAAAGLTYTQGTLYTTQIDAPADRFTLAVTAPAPIAAASVTFSPQLSAAADRFGASLPRHPRNTALSLDWSADTVAADKNAFTAVLRVNYTGGTSPTGALQAANWTADPQNPVFDNLPREPAALIELVLGSPEPSVTIDATTFATVGLYFVILTTTELDIDQTSDNLALGSGAMAGAGTAFVFWVD